MTPRTFVLLALLLMAASGLRADAPVPGIAVGAQMQDFGLRQLDWQTGQLTKLVWLSDLLGPKDGPPRKKLLLLNFFAHYCKPCLQELQFLATWQKRYGHDGLQVVSVNFRAPSETVEDSVASTLRLSSLFEGKQPDFPVLFDRFTNRNQLLYMGSRAELPCNLFIDAQGRVTARFQGSAAKPEALEAHIRSQLGVIR